MFLYLAGQPSVTTKMHSTVRDELRNKGPAQNDQKSADLKGYSKVKNSSMKPRMSQEEISRKQQEKMLLLREFKQEQLRKLEELDLSSLRNDVPLALQPGEVLAESCSLHLSAVASRSEV